ncbi:phosphosulfolactate synthase [Alicyclobacillus fodiniaquatilis]|uniref:Phosphosulfolactate synthase n=1 Tax=Alicyclobacillus fodiniaquatilis TaxID=1661150 RepID=A0ABW4JDL0_9BACL
MNTKALTLPQRPEKSRDHGWTVLIDNGVPLHHFEDIIESHHQLIDIIKFGWGTSVISSTLNAKISCLQSHQVDYFFGGTLFEKFYVQGKTKDYRAYCLDYGCKYVEISNGTIPMPNTEKARFVNLFAKDFQVLSEVGFKDQEKSLGLTTKRWIEAIQEDLRFGATKVILEARESGTSGICLNDGSMRMDVLEAILATDIDHNHLIFEAPNKDMQTNLIELVGANVNLANISFADVIALETLRLGLRSDTLMLFEEEEENSYARRQHGVPFSHSS